MSPLEDSDQFHTLLEIRQAMGALSKTELLRLLKQANVLAGLSKGAVDGGDLLNEAMLRTLQGPQVPADQITPGVRRWRRGVPFQVHLRGAMRSIAGHAAKGPLKGAPRATPPPDEDALADLVELDRLLEEFERAGDITVPLLVQQRATSDSWAEAGRALGLTPNETDAAKKRLLRAVAELGQKKKST
jgi:hypothetical protein